ncbi:MAG: DUF881 domain-containing protein [Clostridiales bacterium]|nr:DUF881 domain-containing protein [Clostridiales bacterium]
MQVKLGLSTGFGLWQTPRKRQSLFLFILLFLFGVIVTNHVTLVNQTREQNNLASLYKSRQEELAAATAQYDSLKAENARLLEVKEETIARVLSQEGQPGLMEELKRMQALAGLTDVTGPGVTVTLNDKPGYDVIRDSADAIVHDSDVRHVLELLKSSGAAALSVNDQRITNASYIFCIGPTILCNMQRLTPPYVIRAVGHDPASMAMSVQIDPMLSLRQTPEIGLVVSIEPSDQVTCPAYAGADNLSQYIDKLEVPAA